MFFLPPPPPPPPPRFCVLKSVFPKSSGADAGKAKNKHQREERGRVVREKKKVRGGEMEALESSRFPSKRGDEAQMSVDRT